METSEALPILPLHHPGPISILPSTHTLSALPHSWLRCGHFVLNLAANPPAPLCPGFCWDWQQSFFIRCLMLGPNIVHIDAQGLSRTAELVLTCLFWGRLAWPKWKWGSSQVLGETHPTACLQGGIYTTFMPLRLIGPWIYKMKKILAKMVSQLWSTGKYKVVLLFSCES